MEPEVFSLRDKRIEQSITSISVKVADAVDLSQKIKELWINSEATLICAQRQLEELYLSMASPAVQGESPMEESD